MIKELINWQNEVRDFDYVYFKNLNKKNIQQPQKNMLQKYYNTSPVLIRTSGGSVPISPFVNQLGIPSIGIPTVNLDNNQHSPNENLRLGNYFQGIESFVSILLESY